MDNGGVVGLCHSQAQIVIAFFRSERNMMMGDSAEQFFHLKKYPGQGPTEMTVKNVPVGSVDDDGNPSHPGCQPT